MVPHLRPRLTDCRNKICCRIAYDIASGFKKLPKFGGTPVFGSISKQNGTIQKLRPAAQPRLTECVSLSNFGSIRQNTKHTVLPPETYIGFSQYREPPELIRPLTESERLAANRPRCPRRPCKRIPEGSVTRQPSSS